MGCACALVCAAGSARADDHEAGESSFHRHHVGLILGGASAAEEHRNDQHGFVIGLDYEYRFSRWIGAGLIGEAAAGSLRDGVVAGSVFIHPWRGLLVAAGPGVEVSSHGTEYVTRVAAAYQFPIARRFSIAPEFSVDILKEHVVYVYGVVFGVGF